MVDLDTCLAGSKFVDLDIRIVVDEFDDYFCVNVVLCVVATNG